MAQEEGYGTGPEAHWDETRRWGLPTALPGPSNHREASPTHRICDPHVAMLICSAFECAQGLEESEADESGAHIVDGAAGETPEEVAGKLTELLQDPEIVKHLTDHGTDYGLEIKTTVGGARYEIEYQPEIHVVVISQLTK